MQPQRPQPELDFGEQFGLPVGRLTFSLKELSERWGISLDHMYRLHQEGKFELPGEQLGAVNFSLNPETTRALIRVSRAAALHFLKSRKQ